MVQSGRLDLFNDLFVSRDLSDVRPCFPFNSVNAPVTAPSGTEIHLGRQLLNPLNVS